MSSVDIQLDDIHVPPDRRLRAIRDELVTKLAESMEKRGLLQPITLRLGSDRGYSLVCGWHRLEAAKRLGWSTIVATVTDLDDDEAELAGIDKNLIRCELSPAERALHVARRKELYEKLHPETRHGGTPGKAGGGKKAKDAKLAAFAPATAKATGQSRRKVERDATRAKQTRKVLEDVVGTSLDKGDQLDALGKLEESEQEALASAAKAGEKVNAKQHVKSRCEGKPVNAKDIALCEFNEKVLRLVQMTRDREPDRFAKTSVPVPELSQLGRFLTEVAAASGARAELDASAETTKTEHADAERRAHAGNVCGAVKRGRRRSSSQRRRERLRTSTTRDFVEVLLAHTTHDLWVCALPNEKGTKGARHVRTRDVGQILEFCKKHDAPGTAVYYCVSSINGTSRNLETVAETPILWFDLDYKDIVETPKQALAKIKSMSMPPTRIHATGNGLHGIYVLREPWRGDIRPALRRLADVVGGDHAVCHPAALLRMPGTHNSKDGAWKLVEVLT